MTKSTPHLDLCSKHIRELHKAFKPRGSSAPPRPSSEAREGKTKRINNSVKKAKFAKMWEQRKRQAMAFFNKTNGWVPSDDMHKALKKVPNIQRVLALLKKDGKIRRIGWSKGARWSKV